MRNKISWGIHFFVISLCCISAACYAKTIYVDDDASLGGTGDSWAPFKYLQDALEAAQTGDEIWVFEGTYTPDAGEMQFQGDRYASFNLKDGVAIYGGFPTGATYFIERDPENYETILSGDLSGNDAVEGVEILRQFVKDVEESECGWNWSQDCWNGLPYDEWECRQYDLNDDCSVDIFDLEIMTQLNGYDENSIHVVTASYVNMDVILDGFTITGGCANLLFFFFYIHQRGGGLLIVNSNISVTNCIFKDNFAIYSGGGIQSISSSVALTECNIYSNYATGNVLDPNSMEVYHLDVGSGMYCDPRYPSQLVSYGSQIEDISGYIVDSGIYDFESKSSSISTLYNLIVGGASLLTTTGSIMIGNNADLIIEDDTIIDMDSLGEIVCSGLLRVKDRATITQSRITVNRLSFEGDVDVTYSIITAEVGEPSGQFFIEDSVTVTENEIHADGDRYMDLDPTYLQNMIIANNTIYITITEGRNNTRGGLFELRGNPDLITPPDDPNFLCQLIQVPDFDLNSWTIEEFKIEDDAKVNLTNRFDFHEPFDSGGMDEVLYVKNLILGSESVLNTAFNRIYYENITIDPNAYIQNIPLLGFSLNNIAFDDENEFRTRIVHTPSYIDRDGYPPDETRIQVMLIRNVPPDSAGMMKMTNMLKYVNRGDLINARAKGLFAKSSEETILVWFEYLFDYDPVQIPRQDVELVVYLSEDPELSQDRIEVARLKAPPESRPGSTGSERFGTFRRFVNTHGLNFIRGTRIELELVGPAGTSVYINNFDPQVFCRDDYCSDVTGDTQVTVLDFLTVVGEYGTTADVPLDSQQSRSCLDSLFSEDGFVDWQDIISWDWIVGQHSTIGHLCPSDLTLTSSNAGAPAIKQVSSGLKDMPAELLIAGKRPSPSDPARLEDKLYAIDSYGNYKAGNRCLLEHANSRLVKSSDDSFYQLNLQAGLVSISDANSLFAPARLTYGSDPRYQVPVDVLIGLQTDGNNWVGRPIQDAVFDAAGNLYVLPVVVDPNTAGEPYMAVAQLQPQPGQNPPYQLIRLYDDPPQDGDNQERNALRELEIDADGYLYVLNAHSVNESSILWVYDTDTAEPIIRVELGEPNAPSYIPGPLALLTSSQINRLYLTSSLNAPDADTAILYQMSTMDFSVSEILIPGMGHITGMTEDPATGDVWVSGFTMSAIPEYLNNINIPPFYEPYIAKVSSTGAVQDVICLADNDPNNDLALPVSIQWTGTASVDSCEGADIDGSGDVGLGDLVRIAGAWLSIPQDANWDPAGDLSAPFNVIDFYDFAVLGRNWKEDGCQ